MADHMVLPHFVREILQVAVLFIILFILKTNRSSPSYTSTSHHKIPTWGQHSVHPPSPITQCFTCTADAITVLGCNGGKLHWTTCIFTRAACHMIRKNPADAFTTKHHVFPGINVPSIRFYRIMSLQMKPEYHVRCSALLSTAFRHLEDLRLLWS